MFKYHEFDKELETFLKSPEFLETGLKPLKGDSYKAFNEFFRIIKFYLSHHFDISIPRFGIFGPSLINIKSELLRINNRLDSINPDFIPIKAIDRLNPKHREEVKPQVESEMLDLLEICIYIYSNKLRFHYRNATKYKNNMSYYGGLIRLAFKKYEIAYGHLYEIAPEYKIYVSFFVPKRLYKIKEKI